MKRSISFSILFSLEEKRTLSPRISNSSLIQLTSPFDATIDIASNNVDLPTLFFPTIKFTLARLPNVRFSKFL